MSVKNMFLEKLVNRTLELNHMTQEEAKSKFLPLILEANKLYKKVAKVKARLAVEGEVIETHTADGHETTATAKSGDYVIQNIDASGEYYILNGEKFKSRYDHISDDMYQAKGEILALVYEGEDTIFIAAWNEPMVLKKGDMICTPFPDTNEVYRIALLEFNMTYALKD